MFHIVLRRVCILVLLGANVDCCDESEAQGEEEKKGRHFRF